MRPVMLRPLRRHHLELHHHQDNQQRCASIALAPVLEQAGPSGMAPVVDLSSPQGEEKPTHDIARDFEFA
jgi:hypothetical protein